MRLLPFRIKIGDGLIVLNILNLFLIASIFFLPSNILRFILGVPFVLFSPGYTLMAVLFPRRVGMGNIERLTLSFGISIAIVSLIGLLLNYTPWGIRLESIIVSVSSLILVMSFISWLRRRRLFEEERFTVSFNMTLVNRAGGFKSRIINVILILCILSLLGTIGYVITTITSDQEYTEFYLRSEDNEIYPMVLNEGEEGSVIVGIINNEHEKVSYRVEIEINGINNNQPRIALLEQSEKWEQEISFIPEMIGANQSIEFVLYKNEEIEPYLEPLRLWFDVRE